MAKQWCVPLGKVLEILAVKPRVPVMLLSLTFPRGGSGNHRAYDRKTILGLHVTCQLHATMRVPTPVLTKIMRWFIDVADDASLFSAASNTFMFAGGRYIAVRTQGSRTEWYDLQERAHVSYETGVTAMPMVMSMLTDVIRRIREAESASSSRQAATRGANVFVTRG